MLVVELALKRLEVVNVVVLVKDVPFDATVSVDGVNDKLACSPAVKFIVTDLVTAAPLASVPMRLKVTEVVAVGVPEIVPSEELSDRPAGRVPVFVQVIGVLPPVTVGVKL
jgi:hypothetical protein